MVSRKRQQMALPRVRLPPEIWTEIAYFACTDGGKTAASLLRVSKSSSEGARIHAYTTVALTGRHSVEWFLNRVTHLSSTQRARIQDLYICQPALESDVSQDINSEGNKPVIFNTDPPMDALLQLLIPLVSPTLRSLALVTFSDDHYSAKTSPMHALTITPLHALRHLTLHAVNQQSIPRSSLSLPAVTHLHVSCQNYVRIKLAIRYITNLAKSMSHLSHLSLYGLPCSIWTRKSLQAILEKDEGRDWLMFAPHVESVRISIRTPAPTTVGEEPVEDFQTRLESAVGQYCTLEFLGAEDRVPNTPEGWLAFWLGQVIDMPDWDVQTNTAATD
jgi:hypothetical protein